MTLRMSTLTLLVLLWLLSYAVHADGTFTPYTPTAGYTYHTLGRYPQTAGGEIRPIPWRVLRVDEEKAR